MNATIPAHGKFRRLAWPVIVMLVILIGACGGGGASSSEAQTPSPASEPAPTAPPTTPRSAPTARRSRLPIPRQLPRRQPGRPHVRLRPDRALCGRPTALPDVSYRTDEAAVLREFALQAGAMVGTRAVKRMRPSPAPRQAGPTSGRLSRAPSVGGGDHFGLWWEQRVGDDANVGRLWTTRAVDYPNEAQQDLTQTITVRELRSDGSVTNRFGDYGFRRHRPARGLRRRATDPAWFKAEHRLTQSYVAGWGGYTSRLAQGRVPSLGLMMLAIPDVTRYPVDAAGSLIPAADFRILGRSPQRQRDGAGTGTAVLRTRTSCPRSTAAARTPNVITTSTAATSAPNGSTAEPPAGPPLSSAQWLSPAPDAVAEWSGTTVFTPPATGSMAPASTASLRC